MEIRSARIRVCDNPEVVRFAAASVHSRLAATSSGSAREQFFEDLVVPVVGREVAGVGPHAEVDVRQVLE